MDKNKRSVTYIVFSQQIINDKLLSVLIWTHYWNYFFAYFSNNQWQPTIIQFIIWCENIVGIIFYFLKKIKKNGGNKS